jgi:hypothetical protein
MTTTTINYITIKTGKMVEKDEVKSFKELKFIVPRNVVSVDYFQLAVQYWTFNLYDMQLQGDITKKQYVLENMPEENEIQSTLKEIADKELDEIKKRHELFSAEYNAFSKCLPDGIMDIIQNDIFAKMFSCVKNDISGISGLKKEYDKKGKVSFPTIPIAGIYDRWTENIVKYTDALSDTFHTDKPMPKPEREKRYDKIREVCNYYMPKVEIDGLYNHINFNKMTQKNILAYYDASGKLSNGKNGGSVHTRVKATKLLYNLFHQMLICLGCEEPKEVKELSADTANNMSMLAVNELLNASKQAENEKPEKTDIESK